MFEQIILGIIQGVTEWLPVSSKGILLLVKTRFFHETGGLEEMFGHILFLHLGTFLAALIYLRKDVLAILKSVPQIINQDKTPHDLENTKTLQFLIITTLISGSLGICIIKLLDPWLHHFENTGRVITFLTGILLFITAYLNIHASSYKPKRDRHSSQPQTGIIYRQAKDITLADSIILGLAQGLSAGLPGLSRSGLTVSTLLLRRFEKINALRLSFLMSLPIVLGGNIVLNFSEFKNMTWTAAHWAGLGASFVVGIATIHALLKIAEKINFGYFLCFFGLLMVCASFI